MKKPLIHINLITKRQGILVLLLLLLSCSSTGLIKSWKNPKFENFKPEKILVIGVTPDYEARKAFEFQIITELNAFQALKHTTVNQYAFFGRFNKNFRAY